MGSPAKCELPGREKLDPEVLWLDLCPRAKFIDGRVVLPPMNIGVLNAQGLAQGSISVAPFRSCKA
jgi:hypothetical protein